MKLSRLLSLCLYTFLYFVRINIIVFFLLLCSHCLCAVCVCDCVCVALLTSIHFVFNVMIATCSWFSFSLYLKCACICLSVSVLVCTNVWSRTRYQHIPCVNVCVCFRNTHSHTFGEHFTVSAVFSAIQREVNCIPNHLNSMHLFHWFLCIFYLNFFLIQSETFLMEATAQKWWKLCPN